MTAEFELTLFISGASDLSARAITDTSRLCDTHLESRYRLSIVDIHEDSAAVASSRIIAVPTLVKTRPGPVRRIVGDLSHTEKVLLALDLPVAKDTLS
jgi:circadian clock protein KaiB